MKIIHTSDIGLGKKFTGFNLAGDKLRAGLKAVFSKIIDYTIKEKADLFIVAGNLFSNLEISRNLQDFVSSELSRLETIPAIIIPGIRDKYSDGSFWKTWQTLKECKNVRAISSQRKPYVIMEKLNLAVYGLFNDDTPGETAEGKIKLTQQNARYHIGVTCTSMDSARMEIERTGLKYDYIVLGGERAFRDLTTTGLKAVFSGAPERLSFSDDESGNIAVVEIDEQKKVEITKVPVGSYAWRTEEIKAREILSNDDLIEKIKELAGNDTLNTAMRVNLTGLTLFEADLSPELVMQHLDDEFLYLEIADNMKVLPENVSEVKVSEKTVLGQYIKVLANELTTADDVLKKRLEKSAKVGLALLQGREIW
jgi:DNA repair exonuclease SbcCD nuclease subunit